MRPRWAQICFSASLSKSCVDVISYITGSGYLIHFQRNIRPLRLGLIICAALVRGFNVFFSLASLIHVLLENHPFIALICGRYA